MPAAHLANQWPKCNAASCYWILQCTTVVCFSLCHQCSDKCHHKITAKCIVLGTIFACSFLCLSKNSNHDLFKFCFVNKHIFDHESAWSRYMNCRKRSTYITGVKRVANVSIAVMLSFRQQHTRLMLLIHTRLVWEHCKSGLQADMSHAFFCHISRTFFKMQENNYITGRKLAPADLDVC